MTETSSSSPIVGIDLGTTNSVVAAVVDGKAEVLTEGGQAILPSVVGVDPAGKLIVGQVARNQQVAFPGSTIASVKRKMGSMEPLTMGDQTFTPPEVSAIILRRLRQRASAVLGTEVTRAVITVPAFFDENQRQATRQAGQLAGLTVERIINEPTAATLVYHAGTDKQKHIVVYDFGGGTFDVSVVRIESGVVEVLSSHGDTNLGGDDLDAVLMKHVADEFQERHGIDLRTDASSRWRLLQVCEAAKRRLSFDESFTIGEEFIAEKDGQPLNLQTTVTRSDYESWIGGLVDRTIDCVDQSLRDANINVQQIDDLVLVGGSTRTPLVERRLREEFGLEPSRAVDPDLAVALGAATQAAMLSGETVGPVLVDVTSHTLGIEAMVGIGFDGPILNFSPIIHRGSPLPASYEQAYSAVHDEQDAAKIHVLQGEHQEIERNRSVGDFLLKLSDPSGDRRKVIVRFDLSLSGTLKVTARQVGNEEQEELTIDNALADFQDQQGQAATERLDHLFDSVDELGVQDDDRPWRWRADAPETDAAQPTVAGTVVGPAEQDDLAPAHAAVRRAKEACQKVDGEDAEDLRDLIERLEAAIRDDDQDAIPTLCDELDDVLFYVGQ